VSEQKISVDIPSLLLKSGLVSTHDLSEAIQVSKRLQIPVSRVLLNSHTFTDEIYHFAIDLQVLMDEELINLEAAVTSLRRVAGGKSTPDQVLDEIYALPKFGRGAKALGELLQTSGIVSAEQIEEGLRESSQTGSTLGSALILRGVLSAGFLPVILRVQERVRKGKVTPEEATVQLRAEYDFWQKAESSQRFASLQAESHANMQELAEKQSRSPMPPNYVPYPIEQTPAGPAPAVSPQPGPAQTTSAPAAAPVAHQSPVVPMQALLAEVEKSPHAASLANMLNQAGMMESSDPQSAYRKALTDPHLVAQVFQAAGLIGQSDFANVSLCHQAVLKGELTIEQAAQALKLAKQMNIPVQQVLDEENGWTYARAQEARKKGMLTGFLAGCAATAVGVGLLLLTTRKDN